MEQVLTTNEQTLLDTPRETTTIVRVLDRVSAFDKKLAEAAGWVVVVMMLTISYDVIMRYLFDAPTTWSFEINRYMLIMVVFLGGSYTLPAGGHVSVDIFTENINGKKKIILDIATAFMAGTYVAIFFIESTYFTWEAWEQNIRSTEYLAWPLWPIRIFLVIGSAMLLLEFVISILKNILTLFSLTDPVSRKTQ